MFRIKSNGSRFLEAGVTESTLFIKGNFPFLSFPCTCPFELNLVISRSSRGPAGTVLSWKPFPRSCQDLFSVYRAIGLDADVAQKLSDGYSHEFDFLSPDLILDALDPLAHAKIRRFVDYLRVAQAFQNGLTTGQYLNLTRFFRGEVWPKVKSNPYLLLAFSDYSVEFVQDLLAVLNIKDSPDLRLMGHTLMVLRNHLDEGHTFLEGDRIAAKVMDKAPDLSLDLARVESSVQSLVSEGVVSAYRTEEGGPLKVSLSALLQYEQGIAENLLRLNSTPPSLKMDPSIARSGGGAGSEMQWSEDQNQGLALFCTHSVVTISGLPGTGKTSLVQGIVGLCKSRKLSFQLLAPTGMATRRLSQLSGHKARTIHSFLGYNGQGFSGISEFNADVLIVDEMSMVDAEVFSHLISSVPSGTRVVLVGDSAQLPSVGPGAVYRDILSSGFPGVHLTQIFRQAADNPIIRAAHEIHGGEIPGTYMMDKDSSFKLVSLDVSSTLDLIKKAALKLHRESRSFQTMAPMYKGPLGIDTLNTELRSVLNPRSMKVTSYGPDYYLNDRVVFTENSPSDNYYNGDFGTIQDYNTSGVTVALDRGPLVKLSYSEVVTLLKPGYCISVHRSQGSEYDVVLLVLHGSHGRMLERTLFYTAVTRAKQKILLFSSPPTLARAVENNSAGHRKTNLACLLQGKSVYHV